MLSVLDADLSRGNEGRELLLKFVSVGVPITEELFFYDTWLICGDDFADSRAPEILHFLSAALN